MRILMCPTDFFDIDYEINPWMHLDNRVDRKRAAVQWSALYTLYRELGQEIVLMPTAAGLPDMVFTANAAVVRGRRAVLSSFRHPERQGEEPHYQSALERLGYEVVRLASGVSFEGAGDALFLGERLFCGWGFRTDVESHGQVGKLLNVETISLRLVNPSFYHLDTCFSPLDASSAIYHPGAFDPESVALIRRLVPNPIEVSAPVAAGFACNAMTIGARVVSSSSITALGEVLGTHGFSVQGLEVTEFLKAGGGVRCLSLPLG